MKDYFKEAFAQTMAHEGGYSVDPDDPGGETYMGIARKHHPEWSGWTIIDEVKGRVGLNRIDAELSKNSGLQEHIEAFYRKNYWHGDEIPDKDIACELFDSAVNVGNLRAIRFLQESVNLLNRDQRDYPGITADGKIGPRTIETCLTCLGSRDNREYLLKVMKLKRAMHYIVLAEKSKTMQKYIRGWLNRVKF